jgi:hypothetical protein
MNNDINNENIIDNMYIVLYYDRDNNDSNYNLQIINSIKHIFNKMIINILSFNEDKNKDLDILEIYADSFTEESLIKNSYAILYLSKYNRSNQLINLLKNYNKNIFYNVIDFNNYDFTMLIDDETILNNINNFENIYLKYEVILKKNNYVKNINITYDKLNNDDDNKNNNMINIITYYKHFELDILNIIQKKCIIENLNNKNVGSIYIFGNNLKVHLDDIFNNIKKDIILHEIDKNISYKDLIEVSNEKLKNKIVCILRSDIMLPNQNNLDYINIDLTINKKDIYILSRIDRMINGNFIRSEKLNKILFSSEQDAVLFKSPLVINNDDMLKVDSIYFYDKYSELYFNKVLKDNNYELINDTNKYKVIRLLYENNLENRLLINNEVKINNVDEVFLLPDNISIEKISIQQILNFTNIDDKELYNLKCIIFNKYLKKKIISEL